MSNLKRIFLGWDRPAVHQVVHYLLTELSPQERARAVVVTPTQASGRTLRLKLAEQANSAGKAALCPKTVLASNLTAPLENSSVANSFQTGAAWAEVLHEHSCSKEWPHLFPVVPTERISAWAAETAQELASLRSRMAEHCCDIEDVLTVLQSNYEATSADYIPDEIERWRDLQRLFRDVDARLRKWGVVPREQAQEAAIKQAKWPGSGKLLLLACLPSVSPLTRLYLQNLHARRDGEIRILIHAPQRLAETFDAFGQPLSFWNDHPIDIDENRLHVQADASSLAEKAVELCGRYVREKSEPAPAAPGIALASCDPQITPALSLAFEKAGWPLYIPQGRHAEGLAFIQMLRQAHSAAAAPGKAAAMLDLLRNPTLQKILGLEHPKLFCSTLDIIMQTHFPETVGTLEMWFQRKRQTMQELGSACLYLRKTRRLVEQLSQSTTLVDALNTLAKGLHACAENQLRDEQEQTPYGLYLQEGAQALAQTAELIADKPALLRTDIVFPLLLQQLSHPLLTPSERAHTVLDASGWLELIYAPGEHLILTGMHAHCVPEPPVFQTYLPDSLCEKLHMDSESARTRRDSFILASILHARPLRYDILTAKQNGEGTPVFPSKLLLRCRPEELTERVQHLYREQKPAPRNLPFERGKWYVGGAQPPSGVQIEDINLIAPGIENRYQNPQAAFSPSAINRFLECPLRFWLVNLLRLDASAAIDEQRSILNFADNGTLYHNILQQFVAEFATLSPQTTEPTMQQRMMEIIEERYRNEISPELSLPLRHQKETAKRLMKGFVRSHLADLTDGWVVESLESEANMTLGDDIRFSMRIDRIDRHRNGRRRIIDYKTNNASPQEKHLEQIDDILPLFTRRMPGFPPLLLEGIPHRWKNVQLPLYAQYASQQFGGDLPEVAYFSMPPGEEAPTYRPFTLLGKPQQENALIWVREAVRLIRAGQCLIPCEAFGRPSKYAPYADIAPDGDLRSMLRLPPLP